MPPTGPISNDGEQGINYGLFGWGLDHPGHTYSQTVQFRLPSGALYLPDASWISQERYDRLTAAEKGGTINGAPDFVVEVHSWSDRLREGLAKMRDWMDGGAKLGWYIHPRRRRASMCTGPDRTMLRYWRTRIPCPARTCCPVLCLR